MPRLTLSVPVTAAALAAGLTAVAPLGVPAAPAGAGGTDTASAASGAPTATASAVGTERSLRRCANRARRKRGLRPLRVSRALGRAARSHAHNMAAAHFVAHTDPQGRDAADRVAEADPGFGPTVGENLTAGFRTGRASCRRWMRSTGHRANILRRGYTHVGAGAARGGSYGSYHVQVLGRRRR